ncbi:DUF169 domain-containing protein [Methanococcoides sp. NM1]|uniref:DUF169 domain-containing protein n=1 Tax=Methanococcoides sp. NM1 TaxID=1201013 RepID=UPI0010841713|nr:DUF169 domain-containing protein [Methanococcoides sp. NM1]
MDIKEINEFGTQLTEKLNLKTKPVAVSLIPEGHDIPEGIEKIDEKTRHCQMVDIVRKTGKQFYSTADDQMCKGGSAVMGLQEMPHKLATGDTYYNLKRFSTINAARRTMEKVTKVAPGSTKAALYGPLETVTFKPDVVVIVASPKQVMQLSQALLFKFGGRVEASFAGIQSVCADGVVLPYKEGKISVTVGCGGSRKFANITENEMIIGIPVERLHDLVEAVNEMFA